MQRYFRFEKGLTTALAGLSALLLATIVLLFAMEILMRYAIGSPTKWSNDVVGFVMTAMIFLGIPEVTRRGQNIAITFLIDRVNGKMAKIWASILALISSAVCFSLFWIVTSTMIKSYSNGLQTNTVIQIPKWLLVLPMSISFLVVSIIFLVTALEGKRTNGLG